MLVSALIAALLLATVGAAASDAKRKSYPNCTALNSVYPTASGSGAPGTAPAAATPVTNFKRSTRLYIRNDDGSSSRLFAGEPDLDRDNDGVACEQH